MKFCYASELGGCEGGITKEHYISEEFIKIISEGNPGGLEIFSPLFPNGHKVSLSSFGLKILCKYHNNELSVIDKVGIAFARNLIKFCKISDNQKWEIEINGNDFERFLLKMMCGSMVKGVGHGAKIIPSEDPPIYLLKILFSKNNFSNIFGLYFSTFKKGGLGYFHFEAVHGNRYEGFMMGHNGLWFFLNTVKPLSNFFIFPNIFHRPVSIKFIHSITGSEFKIIFKWDNLDKIDQNIVISYPG